MQEKNNVTNSPKSLENFDLDAFASPAQEGMQAKKNENEASRMAPLSPDEQYD